MDNIFFVALNKNTSIFKSEEDDKNSWEKVIDFTKIKQGGVSIDEVLEKL